MGVEKSEDRGCQRIFVLQDQIVNCGEFFGLIDIAVVEMMFVQQVKIIEYSGAGGYLGVLRPGRIKVLAGFATSLQYAGRCR